MSKLRNKEKHIEQHRDWLKEEATVAVIHHVYYR